MLENKKILIALMLLIAILLLPNMVNAAVEYTRNFPDNIGTINITFTGLELDTNKGYEFSLVRQGGTPTTYYPINDGYTSTQASITLNTSKSAVKDVLKKADLGKIYIREIKVASDSTSDYVYALENYEVNLKLPYLQSLDYQKRESVYGLAQSMLYETIGFDWDYGADKIFYKWNKVSDIDIITKFLEIKENELSITGLEIYLPEPPTEYTTGGTASFTSKNDGLYLLWVKRIGIEDDKAVYSCIVHDGLPNATTLEEYVGVVNGAPTVESIIGKGDSSNLTTIPGTVNLEFQPTVGDEITINVKFNQDIVKTAAPKLTIKFGTGSNIELTTCEASSNTLTYKYTIKEGDLGALQIVSFTGGNVTNNEGTPAVITLPQLSGTKVVAIENNKEEGKEDNNKKTFSKHTYQIIDKKMSWEEAKKYCESLGGYLVTITSAEEQEFITSFVKEKGFTKNRFWIGATDKENEGTWKWVTGEKFIYTNWSDYQPDNNDSGPQNYIVYLAYNRSYKENAEKWDDIKNDAEDDIYFICEWGDVEKETITNKPTTTEKPTTDKDTAKDTTTAKDKLPNTGKVLLIWIIGIVAVSGIVAHIRYKKLYM